MVCELIPIGNQNHTNNSIFSMSCCVAASLTILWHRCDNCALQDKETIHIFSNVLIANWYKEVLGGLSMDSSDFLPGISL